MSDIVYLLGAGASIDALPIVEQIPNRIKNLITLLSQKTLRLSDTEKYTDLGLKNSKRHYQIEVIENLKWLIKESKHSTVDTLAKKLMLKEQHLKLKKLKATLSVFFTVEQILNQPDKRYDTFFASIIDDVKKLPQRIKILSWNYDFQLELSYSEYSGHKEIEINQKALSVIQKHGPNQNNIGNGFGVYKLNGTAGLFYDGNGSKPYFYSSDYNNHVSKSIIESLIKSYAAEIDYPTTYSTLSFAWEEEAGSDVGIVDLAINSMKDAVVLVVIGYSFPAFNRKIDRRIIDNMIDLKSVYFQAPDADVLLERFKSIRTSEDNTLQLIPKYDCKQFVLPNEL